MERYANGIKFEKSRQLEEHEGAAFRQRLQRAARLYWWHYWIGQGVFWLCLVTIATEILAYHLFDEQYRIVESFSFAFFFMFPPLVGSVQEFLFPTRPWNRWLYGTVFLACAVGVFIPSWIQNGLYIGTILFLVFFGGWIAILLRGFDAKKFLPMVSGGLRDLQAGRLDCFMDLNEQGPPLRMEVFPQSHLIYRVDSMEVMTWETAEVLELADNAAKAYLAPWHEAPPESHPDGVSFFQRRITDDELTEISQLRGRFMKKALVSILPALYLSAVGVRLIENLMLSRVEAGLSTAGWVVAFIMGTFIPLRWTYRFWILRRDLATRQIISIWIPVDDGGKGNLVEEVLSESRLLWSQDNRPSYWRVKKSL